MKIMTTCVSCIWYHLSLARLVEKPARQRERENGLLPQYSNHQHQLVLIVLFFLLFQETAGVNTEGRKRHMSSVFLNVRSPVWPN